MPKEGKAHVLTESEFRRVLTLAKDSPQATRNVAMLYCSFGMGLRVKEISSLSIGDICDHQFSVLDEINLLRTMTKGNKQRHVYLGHKKIIAALTNHLDELTKKNGASPLPRAAPLFKTQRGNRFRPDALQKWFRALYDRAGITSASSHSGRRTFITRLIEQGADIKAVSRLAGHSSIVTTAIYVEDNPDRLKRISHLAVF